MKYRGKIKVTFEYLKQVLKLDDNVQITNIIVSEDDFATECAAIYVSSDGPSSCTRAIAEGTKIPYVGMRFNNEQNIF